MSAQFFLNVEQVLDVLLGELPEGPFAQDRADNPDPNQRSYSSSELRAAAVMLSGLYDNLSDINDDKFITTVTQAGLALWEKELFSSAQDSTLSYTQRQQNLLAKFRASGGISLPAIQSVVAAILNPVGLSFAILPYSGQSNGVTNGAWILGTSQLGLDTFIAAQDPIITAPRGAGLTPIDNNLDYAAAGITLAQLTAAQDTAYTYEVQIYGNADANTLALLDKQLTALEPARSTHIINNNVSQAAPDPAIYQYNTDYLFWWKS